MTGGSRFIGARGDDLRPLDAARRVRRGAPVRHLPVDAARRPHLAAGGRPRPVIVERIPPQIFGMLPYIFTIIVLAGVVGRSIAAGGGRHPVRQGSARLTADDEAATARAKAERARRPRAHARHGRPRTRAAGRSRSSTTPGSRELLATTRRIAIIGASGDPGRPSFGVMRTLLARGLDCVPINPNVRDGARRARLPDARRRRRPRPGRSTSSTSSAARSCACRMPARRSRRAPRCLWLQLGVVDWEAARIAHEAGLSVVMDRCTAIEWGRLAGSGRGRRRAARGRQARRRGSMARCRPPMRGDPPARSALQHERRRRRARAPAIAISPPIWAWRRSTGHRDRGARLAVAAPDAAAPRLVARDVRVLLLERLVARPRTARPRCTHRDQHDPGDHRTMLTSPIPLSPPRRVRVERRPDRSPASAAFAWPRVAFMTWPTRKPIAWTLPAAVVGDRRRVGRQHLVDDAARARRASEIWRKPRASTIVATGVAGRRHAPRGPRLAVRPRRATRRDGRANRSRRARPAIAPADRVRAPRLRRRR